MRSLSIGQYRGLQQCATHRGALAVLALDHRNNLRQALNPGAPESVTAGTMSAFKQQVVRILAPVSSAVLLDPEYGAFQSIASGSIPGSTGLVVAVEATGYTGARQARQSRILPGWSVAKAKRMGASAVKLLVYYHPGSPTAGEVEALVEQVATECNSLEMPLFLEPLSYSLDPEQKHLAGPEKSEVVLETAQRLTRIGGDVLKAEFPLDIDAEPDESTWARACADLTAASAIPWVLLSAAVDFETYLRQVDIACQQGASGVAVGRAVWKEAPLLNGEERSAFLSSTAHSRMARITALCNALAMPWHTRYHPPEADADSFAAY